MGCLFCFNFNIMKILIFVSNLFSGRVGRLNYFVGNIIILLLFPSIILIWVLLNKLGIVISLEEFQIQNYSFINLIRFSFTVFLEAFAIIGFFVFNLSLKVRRFHDLNDSGWKSVLLFVPIVNIVFALILLFSKGDQSKNKYGYPLRKSTSVIDVLLNRSFIYNNKENTEIKDKTEDVDNNNLFIGIAIFIAFIIISISYFLLLPILRNSDNNLEELIPTTTESNIKNEETVKIDTSTTREDRKIENTTINSGPKVSTVKVQKIYNAYGDFYSLSIPTGNSSTCVWNYTGGSGAIPYSETTQATAMEKHNLQFWGGTYDYQVNCFDDFGNQYKGVFPTQ